jgi:hypothetical protein
MKARQPEVLAACTWHPIHQVCKDCPPWAVARATNGTMKKRPIGTVLSRTVEGKRVKLVIEWESPHEMDHTCEVYECELGRMATVED